MGKGNGYAGNAYSHTADQGNLTSIISGGAVDLYASQNANVRINFGTPLSEPLHILDYGDRELR
jgi:hypothetical protein